jgi:hypothetical protein
MDQTLSFSGQSNEGNRFPDDDHNVRDNGLRYNERERERDDERERNFERDRERDRRTDFRGRDVRRLNFRRPSLGQRFHEPRFPADAVRRFDQTSGTDGAADLDRRTEPPSPSTRPTQSGDRSLDDRLASRGPTIPGNRASRVMPLDEHRVSPVEQGARTLAVQASGESRNHPTLDERGTRGSVSSHGADGRVRPSIPLEERLVRPTQDRLAQVSGPRAENNRLTRQSTLEEHPSHTDLGTIDDGSSHPSLQPDDRQSREPPGTADRDRFSETSRPPPTDLRTVAPVDHPGRPRERFARQMTPVQDRPQLLRNRNVGFASAQDPGPPLENDARPAKSSPSPPPRVEPRDYRGLPGRGLSHDAGNIRPAVYRPEAPRGYHDDRRSDLMDIDLTESRTSFHRYPSLSPASTEVNRDRGRNFYPSPPGDAPDIDRRERLDWQFGRRREWNESDNEDQWKTRRTWLTSDRERYDRNAPAQDREWKTREERERSRPPFRSSSPTRSLDDSQHRPPLSTRSTEGISGERGYPPRDVDRARFSVPFDHPYARVRQRSPSPIPRRPSNNVDSRPPIKRAREESGSYPAYYSPPLPPPPSRPMATGSSDLVARSMTPSSPSAGRFYDRPSTLTGPPHDRGFANARERSDIGTGYPMSYNRPPPPPRAPQLSRIPPPSGFGQGGFSRVDARDDRRYNNIPLPRPS